MSKILIVLGISIASITCGGTRSPEQPRPSPPNGAWSGIAVKDTSGASFRFNFIIKQKSLNTWETSNVLIQDSPSCFGATPYLTITFMEQLGPFTPVKLEMWSDSTKSGRYFQSNVLFNQYFTYADGTFSIINSPVACSDYSGQFSMYIQTPPG